ncbi:MAG: hydantoinase B/oxoprolinase family protein, partial [Actinobacteria bacterium]|nr:hydantoinase B/oxoprolinase family protein [Actinomycetota bacterium]
HQGRLVLFAGNRAHHSDVGGSVPGSFPISTEVFEEGIRIPPVRLRRDGEEIGAVMEILLANVRTPREVEGDLAAQLAANEAGVAAVGRLIERVGIEAVEIAVWDSMEHSERAFRASLGLAPGTYEAEDWMDGDGTSDDPVRVRVAVTIEGSDVFVDFSGTAPQARGPINSTLPTTGSMVVAAMLALTDPTIIPNHGFYRPLHIKAPAGSLVNPLAPAPAVGFPDVCNRVVEVIMEALTPALPERAIAATSGTTTNAFFGGTDPRSGEPYVWYSINHQGGWGGRRGADGWHDVCFIEANGWDIPVETIEYRYPWRVVEYRLRTDSAGAGEWRGGEGNCLALTPVGHDPVCSVNGDRAVTPPFGLFGGKPGATARCTIERADGTVERLAPTTMKFARVLLHAGEVIRIEATSGGGYGNPLRRDPAAVVRDIRDGLVSPESARRDYGVVVDPASGELDPEATAALRKALWPAFEAIAPGLAPIDRTGYDLDLAMVSA